MKTQPPEPGAPHPGDDLDAQAWQWLRLLHSGEVREVDGARFKRWVQASAAHRRAYLAAKQQWDALEAPARAVLRAQPDAVPAPRREVPLYHRRAFLGAAASVVAVATLAAVRPPLGMWPSLDEWGADERTGAGQQRTVALAGGADLTLNTRTSIRRQPGDGERNAVELISGEASVGVGAGQRVTVVAGTGRSHASNGRFDVRNLDGKVCVTCVAGAVTVEHPHGTRGLMTGQQVQYEADAIGSASVVSLEAATAWRSGKLVFDRTRLSEVIEEINRYRDGRVVLMNDAAGKRPVSGRFEIASLDLALVQLQESFALTARDLPAGLLILS